MTKLLNWWPWGRKKVPQPLSRQLQPLILRTSSDTTRREVFVQDPAQVEEAESSMNVAMRAVVNVMAMEGLISREQAKEFMETHGVIVAYRSRGLGSLLRGLGVSDDDVKANRSRVTVVRLAGRD
jgi:hypothetical protein